MKQTLKIIIIPWVFMVLFGSMLLALPGETDASDWTEGKLVKIIGLDSAAGGKTKMPDLSKIEMMMNGGNTFGVSPDIIIKDAKGNYISIDTLEPPYEVRYIAEDMMIKEIIIIAIIPR